MSSDNSLLDGYLSERQLAKQLNVSLHTMRHWRKAGIGPPITHIGRTPVFKIKSVQAWLDSCERSMPRERRRAEGRKR